jgi:membrane fusion protein, multidrug efflux system
MMTPAQDSAAGVSPTTVQSAQRAPRRSRIWLAVVCVLLAAAAAYWYSFQRPAASGNGAPHPGRGGPNAAGRSTPVATAPARKGDVDVYVSGLGSVVPVATVTVRSRIDGQLMKVLFREGQTVRAGDVLAEIDPRPYRVQLAQAEGQMAKDQALLQNARMDLERYRVLLEQDSIARQQLDTQQSLVRQYEGTVRVDQAQIDNARLQLTYCRITAPVGGRLGLRQVDTGNMVHASDAAGLVVITQLQPITVVFTIPEDSLPPVMQKLRAADRLAVDAYDRADQRKLASGTLLTVDNQIDPATGTVKLKAQFANRELSLFPNQFANVRMLLEVKRGATLVPGAAVQRGTPGTFVYLVRPDNTVTVRAVKLGPAQGDDVAIEAGLVPGEQVVVDGADKLREGAKIEPVGKDAAPGAAGARKGGASAAAPGAKAAPSDEERRRRWAEINARIDRGEFGEEMKKLAPEERMRRMAELRRQREAGDSGSQSAR